MRLYEALHIAPDASAKQVAESYRGIVREAAGCDVGAANEAFLVLHDRRRRRLYDLLGDAAIGVLSDSRAAFVLAGVLQPLNLVLLVAGYEFGLAGLVLLPLLLGTEPRLPARVVGLPFVLAALLLAAAAFNAHRALRRRDAAGAGASEALRLALCLATLALGLSFVLVHLDCGFGAFRCLLLGPFAACEVLWLGPFRRAVPRKRFVAQLLLSATRLSLCTALAVAPGIGAVGGLAVLNVAAHACYRRQSPAVVAAATGIAALYVLGLLLLESGYWRLVALANSVLLGVLSLAGAKLAALGLRREAERRSCAPRPQSSDVVHVE